MNVNKLFLILSDTFIKLKKGGCNMQQEQNALAPYEKQFDIAERKKMVAEMMCELRKGLGWPQKEVAQILGVSPQTYNGYEKGRNEPPIEMLVRLSFLYNVPIDMIVQRDRMHALNQSAMETVKVMEQGIAAIRENLSNDPMAQNEQVQALISAMEQLTEMNRKLIEKNSL